MTIARSRSLAAFLTAMAVLSASSAARAQSPEADPAARKAFGDLIRAYRDKPGLTVKTTVKIELMEGDTIGQGSEVKAEFTFARDRKALVKLKGFTCYLSDKTITAVHEGNVEAYFSASDDGSPYYALLAAFVDMPFPELALALGEDEIDDVVMQFHPRAPWARPVSVKMEDIDGRQVQKIKLASDFDTTEIIVDPKTRLMESVQVQITSGDFVQAGHTLLYHCKYENTIHEQPPDPATFKLEPAQRQRVDLMAMLPPPPPARAADGGPGAGPQMLEGQPAPPIVLATADGKAIDLQDLRGRVVVLDFWASWCTPCMQALPLLHQVAKWASDEQLPVTVLTINVWEIRDKNADSPDARVASARATWIKRGFTLPILMDHADEAAAAYGVGGIPTTIVIRSDGVVHKVHVGAGGDYVSDLKRDIDDALKAVAPGM